MKRELFSIIAICCSLAAWSNNITFADANVKALCVANWDTDGDGELSTEEASAVSDIGVVFKGNTEITSFDELRYFNGLTIIPWAAFSGCSSLSSITIPTSATNLSSMAFSDCCSLVSLDIPNSVNIIGSSVFSGCSALASITIPNGVKAINTGTFDGCSHLESITIPSSVTSIGMRAFFQCRALESLVIPNSVTSIGDQAFRDCSGMTSLTISEGIKEIPKSCFIGCNSLTSLAIPEGVTTIGQEAFESCANLQSVSIPSSVTSIGNYAFSYCNNLTSVSVFMETPISISSNVFTNLGNMTLRVPDGCKDAYETDETWSQFASIREIPAIIEFVDDNVKALCVANWDTDGDGELSKSEAAAVTNLDAVFMNNTNITSFDELQYFSGLKNIGQESFSGCTELTSITLPENITTIGANAFFNCQRLTSFIIPENVTSIGERAFYYCLGMTSIVIPEGVASIGDAAFMFCEGLTSVTIPGSVTSMGNSVFSDCCTLASVTFSEGVTSVGQYAFYECGNLQSVSFPSSLITIDNGAFQGCYNLTGIEFAEGLTTIGDHAFDNCNSLDDITIPSTVTSIGDCAFSELSSVTVKWTDPIEIDNNAFYAETLYVPAGFEHVYAETYPWCEMFNEIEGLESLSPPIVFADENVKVLCVANWDTNGDGELSYGEAAKVTDLGAVFKNNRSISSFEELQFFTGLTAISREAFHSSGLTSTTIPSGVTSIESYAFNRCCHLTSITIPKSVTSVISSAFEGCIGMTSVIVEAGNTVYDSRDNCNAIIKTATNELIAGCKSTTIPNSVTSIGDYAFFNCSSLTSVDIPNSVTSIGLWAFCGCRSLTSITIPNSVTRIEQATFSGCEGLTSITIPNSVTSISRSAFNGCEGLTSITIPNSVTSIGAYAFSSCDLLTSIVVESGNTVYDSRENCNAIIRTTDNELIAGCKTTVIPNSVTSIGDYAFDDCSGLTSITIPNSVTSIGEGAFRHCDGLTSITIPNTVTSIGDYVFSECDGLAFITIPNSVTSIGDYAFSYCNSLTFVTSLRDTPPTIYSYTFENRTNSTLYVPKGSKTAYETAEHWKEFRDIIEITEASPIIFADANVKAICLENWDTDGDGELSYGEAAKVTDLGNVFRYNKSISSFEELQFFNGITSIASQAFMWCYGLTSIIIPESVTSIESLAFDGCSSLTSITIPNSVTCIGYDAFSSCSSLTSITIPNSVTRILHHAFSSCSSLTSITIPNSVTSIQEYAFRGCSSLTSITIPRFVTFIGNYAFSECSSLTSMLVEAGNTVYDSREGCNAIIRTADNDLIAGCNTTVIPNSVTSIARSAFSGCEGLTSITIPNSVTSIGNYAFSRCNSLTSMLVETGNTVYDSREGCNAIVRIADNDLIAGCKTTVIPNSVTSIGNGAFEGCSGLTSITIPNSVTSIGDYSFSDCIGLTSITIPNSVTSIARSAFSGCEGLTSITIPNSVTSIGNYAFFYCSGLTTITIPNSVTSIEDHSFYGCSSLTSVTSLRDTPPTIYSYTLGDCYNATLYVPKGSKAAYEAADYWKGFKNIVEIDMEESGDGPQEVIEVTDVATIDNVIYVEPMEVVKGSTVELPIKMKNTTQIRGFQFDMYLPQGVTVKKNAGDRIVYSLNSERLPEGSVHEMTVSEQPDGAIRFLCSSQHDEYFTGNDGEIATIKVVIDENLEDGDYLLKLKDVKLTETDIRNYYLTEQVKSKLTVIPFTLGDINNDGMVDVCDYTGVANHIHGNTPDGFIFRAGDVDESGGIDVSDYTGIANIILYSNLYGNPDVNASRRLSPMPVIDVSQLDNVIYIEPFEAEPGDELQLKVKMKNNADIRGFQFDLYLPEGITVKKYDNGRIVSSLNEERRSDSDHHTLALSEQSDGAIRFLCGSQYDETFTGTDGEIATLTVNISGNMEEDNYPVYLRNMKLTETDISRFYITSQLNSTAMVSGPWLPGDANGDGQVNVTDIMAVANRILNIQVQTFKGRPADVNKDGSINVTDIMGIANIILKVTPSSNSRATSVVDAVEPQ